MFPGGARFGFPPASTGLSPSGNGNGAPGTLFPLPYLLRFPPPFLNPALLQGTTQFPGFPHPAAAAAAFSALLESKARQMQELESGPGTRARTDTPSSPVLPCVPPGSERGVRKLHGGHTRPTKSIHFRVLEGRRPERQFGVTLRHTEDVEALDKLCESDVACEWLTVIVVSAADSVSHAVVFTSDRDAEAGDHLELPEAWKQVCHVTTVETEANVADDGTVLQALRHGTEVVVLRKPLNLSGKTGETSSEEAAETFSDDPDSTVDSKACASSASASGTASNNSFSISSFFDLPPSNSSTSFPPLPSSSSASSSAIGAGAGDVGGFQCDRCGKMFSYAYYRDKHLKYTRCVDNGDRKFPCPLCTRSFEKRDRLRIHILHVHENHRPHVCSVCGKSFSQSSSLNKHLRVHSGERPYKCPFCSKCFTASSILRTHIRQHSGEKPFKCAFCGKSFASHAAHDSHVRRTHSDKNTENLFKCHSCEKCFDHEAHLQFHIQCFHAIE